MDVCSGIVFASMIGIPPYWTLGEANNNGEFMNILFEVCRIEQRWSTGDFMQGEAEFFERCVERACKAESQCDLDEKLRVLETMVMHMSRSYPPIHLMH